MPRPPKYRIEISREFGRINFLLKDFNCVAYTEDNNDLWETITSNRWTIQLEGDKPRYLYSNTCRKSLHQMVVDHYFGEAVRKKAYDDGMIIEHLNNDGLDCQICNLYFLHDIRNKYKGSYFDKRSEDALSFFALRVFHNIRNGTFQITIGFTADAKLSGDPSKPLQSIMFLYKNINYWNVIQDAEMMLDELIDKKRLNFQNGTFRYVDWKAEFGEYVVLTEEEAQNGISPGCFVWRDGIPLMVIGDPNHVRIISSYYDANWDMSDE